MADSRTPQSEAALFLQAHWDWLIIGSGFGGSVCALRLAEKGYSVLVLEKGRRWQPAEFPKTNWNLRRWLWRPRLGLRGAFRMTFLRHVTSLGGVGVGGGSLVYANALPIPPDAFFRHESWAHLADWKAELAPRYQTARHMLGATAAPMDTAPDRALRAVAERINRGEHLVQSPVAVFFGDPGVTVTDPFHGGAGPERTGCTLCGACMTGCRVGAKNTLDMNYLWMAERLGARILPEAEAICVRPASSESDSAVGRPGASSGYEVTALVRARSFSKKRRTFRARNVVFAAGVLGTMDLLLRMKRLPGGLPDLSARLGDGVRTNSEVLIGVTSLDPTLDMSEGVAITSLLHVDDRSSLEPVRFGSGSGFFRLLALPHAPGASAATRLFLGLRRALRQPLRTLRALLVRDWARRTSILLFMRTEEGFLRLRLRRRLSSLFRLTLDSELSRRPAPTAALPMATQLAEEFAREVDGVVGSLVTETLFGIPTTAHMLGGACMGTCSEDGVIDHRHRVFGYEGLYVVDGSSVSANPGVNPSLTIAALAERAMSPIPPKPR